MSFVAGDISDLLLKSYIFKYFSIINFRAHSIHYIIYKILVYPKREIKLLLSWL